MWIAVFAGLCFSLSAQDKFGVKVNVWTLVDDNAFRNYQMLSDVVTQPGVTLYYYHPSERSDVQLEYNGSLAYFQNYLDRKFQHHFLGASGSSDLNDSATVSLYWTLRGGRRWNGPDYRYYDYGNVTGSFNVRYDAYERGSVTVGLGGQIQEYQELPEFNFTEIRTYVQPTLYLPTRTSLIGQVQAGYKKYTEPVVSEEVIRRVVPVRIVNSDKVGGRWRYGGVTIPVVVNRTVRKVQPGKSVLQVAGLLRVAQSVFEGTGIAVQGLVRRNPRANGLFASFQDSGYEEEDPLYDDPYSYETDALSVEATQMLFWGMSLKLGWDAQDKRYSYAAYDMDGSPLPDTDRRDRRTSVWVSLKKTLPVKGFSPNPVLSLSFSAMRNRSNDPYYDYSNRVSSAGLSFGL